jgi:hypothetical protein
MSGRRSLARCTSDEGLGPVELTMKEYEAARMCPSWYTVLLGATFCLTTAAVSFSVTRTSGSWRCGHSREPPHAEAGSDGAGRTGRKLLQNGCVARRRTPELCSNDARGDIDARGAPPTATSLTIRACFRSAACC